MKQCMYCGKDMPKHKGETVNRYAVRKFCSCSCGSFSREARDRALPRLPRVPRTELRCGGCKTTKPIGEFNSARGNPTGHSYRCRDCEKAARLLKKPSGKELANSRVRTLIEYGRLLRAKEYPCVCCGGIARLHHHPSYLPGDHLNVVPVCDKCHGRLHRSPGFQEVQVFGVVALPIGLVRIAIAGLNK